MIPFCLFFFLGPHLWHIEVPRLGVESELQLLAYTTVYGNARSSIHCSRPGMEPSSSWILVRFSLLLSHNGDSNTVFLISNSTCSLLGKQFTFAYLALSATLLWLFTSPRRFSLSILWDFLHRQSSNKDSFISSFSICMPFISFLSYCINQNFQHDVE